MAVSKIKPYKNVKLVEYRKEYTIQANGNTSIDFTPDQDGWTPCGIVGSSTGHGSVLIQQARMFTDTNNIRMTVRNIASAAATPTAIIEILYIKN